MKNKKGVRSIVQRFGSEYERNSLIGMFMLGIACILTDAFFPSAKNPYLLTIAGWFIIGSVIVIVGIAISLLRSRPKTAP